MLKKRRKDNRLTLLYKGLKGKASVPTDDLIPKTRHCRNQHSMAFQTPKIIVRYKRIGYNMNIIRQSVCLVFNPITVNNFASLFNCTPVGRASDSVIAPT